MYAASTRRATARRSSSGASSPTSGCTAVDVTADGSASEPRPITPEPPAPRALRYADGRVTPDGRTLVCVRERHEGDEVVNELVALPADGSAEPG